VLLIEKEGRFSGFCTGMAAAHLTQVTHGRIPQLSGLQEVSSHPKYHHIQCAESSVFASLDLIGVQEKQEVQR